METVFITIDLKVAENGERSHFRAGPGALMVGGPRGGQVRSPDESHLADVPGGGSGGRGSSGNGRRVLDGGLGHADG